MGIQSSISRGSLAVALMALLALGAAAAPVAAQEFQMTGNVASATNATPLQYAVVGIPELSQWDLTDEAGAFALDIPAPGTYRLIVLRRGFYLHPGPGYVPPDRAAPWILPGGRRGLP